MYGRINNWSDIPSDDYYHHAGSWEQGNADDFADAFARMRLQDSADGSSSHPNYHLTSRPPVVEIDRETFRREVRTFHGDAINHIANNPQEYSDFVSERARRTADVARNYGIRRDSDAARYYSYQLGNTSVGLQRTEAGFPMSDFYNQQWREQFPGRDVTSTVDFQVAHPLVGNAGDILLEHQLRQDGERPLVNWRPANDEARARAEQMGFVEVDQNDMVLDPTQSRQWRYRDGEWQRATNSPMYLSKVASDTESSSDADSDGDFM
ncbi:effector protein NopP [Bradyrhizobium sp. BWA-3-5]|uniref:effector protein NopP n=1 Tax=Bradyrhizobium sp. BWA-3-5 TaxID=3080013 RepID=UPI00293E1C4A|nr:effector protein NopP [Bradyrhizobium sp. BWA-3-5]WOH63618.1 effector protein NopP [Bradyrhizobium sp. BWA-3-5]